MWAARILGAIGLLAFAYLVWSRGIPRSFDPQQWEVISQVFVLTMVVVGYALAWRWDGIGGIVLLVGAILLAILASIEYRPMTAVLGALLLVVPGTLFLLHWERRHHPVFLVGIVATLAVLLYSGNVASARVYNHYYGPTHPESSALLPALDLVHWVWTGGVTTTGFSVNARLADDVAGSAAELLVSESVGLSDPVRIPATVTFSGEHNVVKFTVSGLRPGFEYHYGIFASGRIDEGRRGRVRTFPDSPASFVVAVGSCIRTGSNGSVFDQIRAADPLLFLADGDFQYDNISTNDPAAFRDALSRNLSAPGQQSLYLQSPIAYTWDDHDYGGNDSDRTAESRPAATAVYRETVPHYDLPGPNGEIYQAFSIGRVRFILTDNRSSRDPATETDGPAKSMLGETQKAWFKSELLAANGQYPLIVWVNPVPWIAEAEAGADNWAGYATERKELANFIAENNIKGLAMLSGDAHMLAIDDGTNSDFSDSGNAGFPVLHAAALDRRGMTKGGPYSEGAFPGGGQFALMTVTDNGGATLRVEWSGRNFTGAELVSYAFEVGVTR